MTAWEVVAIIISVIGMLFFVAAVPLATLFVLNVLFRAQLPYSWETWLAALLLWGLIFVAKGRSHNKA